MRLILYSKPGCHLCEGLREKLEQIHSLELQVEERDITTNPQWFQAYEYEIPVLFMQTEPVGEVGPLPRISPRASVAQVERSLQQFWSAYCQGDCQGEGVQQ